MKTSVTFTDLLSDMDWSKESMNLQKNLALGDAKHRKLVQSLYDEVKKGDLSE
jgi:hypothetical protein